MNDARSATGLVIRLPWTIIHFHHSTTAVNKCVCSFTWIVGKGKKEESYDNRLRKGLTISHCYPFE